jgi:hypothetical protein
MLSLAISLWSPAIALADVFEGFEGEKTLWHLDHHDCVELRVISHKQSRSAFHTGGASEGIEFETGYGTQLYYIFEIQPVWLNYDIDVGVWVKVNRPGTQLRAEIVLPNTLDANRQKPLRIPIYGTVYDRPGQWQHLTCDDLLESLQKKLPVLRSEHGAKFDLKGAYVAGLSLNLYSGRGRIQASIDDLSVQGGIAVDETRHLYSGPGISPADFAPDSRVIAPPEIHGAQLIGQFGSNVGASTGAGPEASRRPMFLRIARRRGESFRWLKSLGFNTILLDGPVSEEHHREALELELWLIAPPPQQHGEHIDATRHGRVAAWWLGDDLELSDLQRIRALAQNVRQDDPFRRPVGASPRNSIWQFGRTVDILMFRYPGLGGDRELSELSAWLIEQKSQDSRRSIAFFELPADYPLQITRQLQRVGMDDAVEAPVAAEQLRLMAFRAAAAGVRGICVTANSRLDETTSAASSRAVALEWILSELAIIEPWVAAGTAREKPFESNPGYDVHAIDTDTSTLLIVASKRKQQQYTVGGLSDGPQRLSIPPVPGNPLAHQMTPFGLERLRIDRRAGSREMILPFTSHVSLIALTDDPLAMEHLARQVNSGRKRRTSLILEVAQRNSEHVRLIHQDIARTIAADEQVDRWLADIDVNLSQAKALINESGDFHGVGAYVQRAMNRLSQIRERDWRVMSSSFARPVATAAAAGFMTLPAHQMFRRQISSGKWGPNQRPEGDMESLSRLLDAGWLQTIQNEGTAKAVSSIQDDAPFEGRASLQLAISNHSANLRATSDRPNIRIQSPAVRVASGQVVQFRCRVRLLEQADDSTRMAVHDSIGGPVQQWTVAEHSDEWEEVLGYRVCSGDGFFSVEFSLEGVGKAQVDDLEIRILETKLGALRPEADTRR